MRSELKHWWRIVATLLAGYALFGVPAVCWAEAVASSNSTDSVPGGSAGTAGKTNDASLERVADAAASLRSQVVLRMARDAVAHPEDPATWIAKDVPNALFAALVQRTAPRQASAMKLGARLLAEIGRTDKQLGSTSGSASTTLVHKPGVSELLAFGLEHGLVQEEEDDTTVTIRSSPAPLYGLASGVAGDAHWFDARATDRTYASLARFGAFMTLPLDDAATSGGGGSSDTEADPGSKAISEWGVDVDLSGLWGGSRGGYSEAFDAAWEQKARAVSQQALNAFNQGNLAALNLVGATRTRELQEVIMAAPAPATEAAWVELIERSITAKVEEVEGNPEEIKALMDQFSEVLVAYRDLRSAWRSINESMRDQRALIATLNYTNHPVDKGSDYSSVELKASYQIDPLEAADPFDVIFNGGASFYHDPDESAGQDTVRDYSVGLSTEFKFANAFALSEETGSELTASLGLKWVRLESDDDDAWSAQGKIDVPIYEGLDVPLSLTYSTRTDLIKEDEVRGNFGFTFDYEKFDAARMLRNLLAGGQAG